MANSSYDGLQLLFLRELKVVTFDLQCLHNADSILVPICIPRQYMYVSSDHLGFVGQLDMVQG